MTTLNIRAQIRAKKIGVLLRDARLAAGKTVQECADAIQISKSTYRAYEAGTKTPSLPEIEVLAYTLKVPMAHFWGKTSLAESSTQDEKSLNKRLLSLRQRVIGVMVRQARKQSDFSLTALGKTLGVSAHTIKLYELGEKPIPISILEGLCQTLDIPLNQLRDQNGPVGEWVAQQQAIEAFLKLPPEIQEFISKPVNQPYLNLAHRLSEMSVDKLRTVAEGLLDITL